MASLEVCRNRIMSEDYRDMILGWNEHSYLSSLVTDDTCVQNIEGLYRIVYIPKELSDPIGLDRYNFVNIPLLYGLIDTEAMDAAGITAIQRYPTLQLMGEGVMIGFLDTGIDYQNQVFKNMDGSTRIAGLWDQTIPSGTVPDGFLYGSEYTDVEINEALRNADPLSIVPSVDDNGHGTFVASLAAGTANPAESFSGAAPLCTLGVVKLKQTKQFWRDFFYVNQETPCYADADVMLAIKYLDNLARSRNMPLVLCIALGTNMGGHTGRSPLSDYIEDMTSSDGRVVVVGTGNEADKRHHYFAQIAAAGQRRTVEIQVASGVQGFSMELWSDIPNVMMATVVSPSGEETPVTPAREGATLQYQFIFERTVVNIDYKIYGTGANSEVILFRFGAPVQGIWKINIEAQELGDGIFHMWLPMTEFLTGETVFLEPSPDYTVTSPGVVSGALTVGYYNDRDGSLAISSGRGYNRSGGIKPNLVAPGVDLIGALPGGQFTSRTGSSLAVAITAGASALLAEWAYYQVGQSIDTLQAKNLLIFGATKQPEIDYPNNDWGYGELNLFHTFEQLRRY